MYNAKFYKGSAITEAITLNSKNQVDLRVIVLRETQAVSHYEIYVNNEFYTKYENEKTARKMWKDFAA